LPHARRAAAIDVWTERRRGSALIDSRRWWWWSGAFAFVLVATANGGGYRYGTSDQAFYIPVVLRALNPAAFPRDAPLIDAQGRLMLSDEILAGIMRLTGLPLDILYLAGYLLSLLLIWLAIVAIGRTLYRSVWLTVALAAAFTLRHRIPRTSANSFEPYFHPRMLAFGLGALAIAAVLRRRFWLAIAAVGLAAIVHVTTGLWFAVLLGVAIAILDRQFRRLAVVGAAGLGVLLVWAVMAGPLRDSFVTMDQQWLAALASKDSLLASDWPAWAWAANLGFLAIAWAAHSARRTSGGATREENALLWGAMALVALFLATFPLVVARFALPVQLQIPRVFWLVDFLALALLVGTADRQRTAKVVAVAVTALAVARGAYVLTLEHPERALFAVHLPASEWADAMAWIAQQPIDAHVLADPGHAWKYGTSVRVSAGRDVLLEDVKDSAVAIYSRDMALRYTERAKALAGFASLTADRARALAAHYDLDYLVAEADVPLPVAYSNSRFKVYRLAP
jgi:hypothetical protein